MINGGNVKYPFEAYENWKCAAFNMSKYFMDC